MRNYLVVNKLVNKIIDFEDNLVFEDATTYTAITVLQRDSGVFSIIKGKYENDKIQLIELNNNHENLGFKKYFEEIDIKLNYIYLNKIAYIANGLATLNDHAFIINENEIIKKYKNEIVFLKDNHEYIISNKSIFLVKRPSNPKLNQYLVYPYVNFLSHRIDKRKRRLINYLDKTLYEKHKDKYGYGFGRTQGLKYFNYEKIVIPKVAQLDKGFSLISIPCFVMAGLYIVIRNEYKKYTEEILNYLNSDIVREYLINVSKNYSSSYRNISSNDLKKIRIPYNIFTKRSN